MTANTAAGTAVAAVDLGSNSFHLVVARLTDGTLRVEDRHKERVMLAAGLDARGNLDAEAEERAMSCLRRFRQRLEGIPSSQIQVAATDTFRATRAPRDFHARAEEALGHSIAVVHGEEEARLVYGGVRYDIGRHGRLLVGFDIGGGSTELFQGRGETPEVTISLRMGSSSWSQRYFPDGRISKRRMQKAILAARHEVEPVSDVLRSREAEFAVGSSGTCLALARVLQASGATDGGLSLDGLHALRKELTEYGSLDEVKIPGLKDGRRPVFLGGLCVLIGVMEELDLETALVSPGALREGLLLDLVGRLGDADLRSRTVAEMARRFHADPQQAGRVRASALRLADCASTAWEIDAEDRLFLGWAAELHEIGRTVRHAGYHRHGAYLAANTDMPGFSMEESKLLARLLRRHKGRLAAQDFEELSEAARDRMLRLLLPLRLATRLHRARRDRAVPADIEAEPRVLRMRLEPGWLDDHPLTALDLEVEAEHWQAVGYQLVIEE